MEITVKIDESLFEGPVKQAVVNAIHSEARTIAIRAVNNYKTDIEKAIETYLNKTLTVGDIKNHIDSATKKFVDEYVKNRFDKEDC